VRPDVSWQWRPPQDPPSSPAASAACRFQAALSEPSRTSLQLVPQRKGAASWPRLCVRGFCTRGDWLMFEQNPKEVEALMQSNAEFRSLYQRHKELDSKVRDAELGVLPMDDVTLHNMKKEKLHAKDKLTSMWAASH
jgi:uncharacterized protein YdcH (DUF465 family)